MLKNYLKTAARNLLKHRGYSLAVILDLTKSKSSWSITGWDLVGPQWKSPLGKRVDYYESVPEGWRIGKSGPVIGVIKDFHYRSLHSEVEPMALQINRNLQWKLLVRIHTNGIPETLKFWDRLCDRCAGQRACGFLAAMIDELRLTICDFPVG